MSSFVQLFREPQAALGFLLIPNVLPTLSPQLLAFSADFSSQIISLCYTSRKEVAKKKGRSVLNSSFKNILFENFNLQEKQE